jgi:prophage tail gpP-like protein
VIDVRENILVRLLEVVASIPNIRSAQRNSVDIPEDQLPAAIVFDGDEETQGALDHLERQSSSPVVMHMQPEIVIAQQADEVGSELTTLRRELVRRVLTDTVLNEEIVKTWRNGNGAIRYLGCQTDLGWGRSLQGALRAQFLFRYSLKIEEL